MEDMGEAQTDVIDLEAARRLALEDAQLRILARAVGEHPLPSEELARLERVRAQLLDGPEAA